MHDRGDGFLIVGVECLNDKERDPGVNEALIVLGHGVGCARHEVLAPEVIQAFREVPIYLFGDGPFIRGDDCPMGEVGAQDITIGPAHHRAFCFQDIEPHLRIGGRGHVSGGPRAEIADFSEPCQLTQRPFPRSRDDEGHAARLNRRIDQRVARGTELAAKGK